MHTHSRTSFPWRTDTPLSLHARAFNVCNVKNGVNGVNYILLKNKFISMLGVQLNRINIKKISKRQIANEN